jgi:hypothetical protein
LPAWENSDKTFTIPNSENGGSWERFDPRNEIEKIKKSDEKTGQTKMLIRMIKKWAEQCSAKIKSYKIEKEVLEFFDYNDKYDKCSSLIRDFFDFWHNHTADDNLKSHLNTALNRSKKACEYEGEDKTEKAIDEWRKIFGDDFPSINNSVKTATELKPSLSDHSHCELPKWTIEKFYNVNIDTYIYTENKTKKLGGINSDGRVLSPGFNLKFYAKTNARGIFKYYWQVVNTGRDARINNDLRGQIFEGNQVHWEHTRYSGKHWIECFIVQDNICVARSGRFFINIK